ARFVEEEGTGFVLAVEAAGFGLKQAGETRRDLEARFGELDGGREEIGPVEPAVAGMHLLHQAGDAGHADGATADDGIEEGERLAIVVEEEVGTGGGGRGLARVIGGELTGFGIVPEREGAAADP